MALHKDFPSSPYAILDPTVRWLPGDGAASPEKLLPPLVAQLRRKVKEFRDSGSVSYTHLDVYKRQINTYARMKHRLVAPKLNFKDFRKSTDFQVVAQDIVADAKLVMKQCAWVANGLELPLVDGLLDEYAHGKSDFNDQVISAFCSQHGLKLVTDDSDFKDRNIPILTANSQLLV